VASERDDINRAQAAAKILEVINVWRSLGSIIKWYISVTSISLHSC